jgi:hypothetical protein
MVIHPEANCGESGLPFTLLEVYHGVRDKAPMPSTSACSDPSGLQIVPIGIDSVDRLVIMAGGFLG